MDRLLRIIGMGAVLLTVAACSNGSSSGEYGRFCDLAAQMDQASSGPHGDNPGAITDPTQMRAVWESITAIASEMDANAPDEIAVDLDTMLGTLFAMNEIFAENDYDLTAMARDADIRAELDATSTNEATREASQRFNRFVERNCPVT